MNEGRALALSTKYRTASAISKRPTTTAGRMSAGRLVMGFAPR
jgi:hypothetical protein